MHWVAGGVFDSTVGSYVSARPDLSFFELKNDLACEVARLIPEGNQRIRRRIRGAPEHSIFEGANKEVTAVSSKRILLTLTGA
jgi:hypothetical protein